jgi:hypothetical protein
VPVPTVVSAPALVIVQTLVVDDVNATVRPELAVADSVGEVPKFCVPGLANVIVCTAAVMVNDCETCGAAKYAVLPA